MSLDVARHNLAAIKKQLKLAKLMVDVQILAARLKKKNDEIQKRMKEIETEFEIKH